MYQKELIRSYLSKALTNYGSLALLLYLERLEKREEFEICSLIVEVIESYNDRYKTTLPTKVTEDDINFLSVKLDIPESHVIDTFKSYSIIIEDQIKEIYKNE